MPYTCAAVRFNGTAYLSSTTTAHQWLNSKVGLLSVWVQMDGGDGTEMTIFRMSNGTTDKLSVVRTTDNRFRIIGRNAAGTIILQLQSSVGYGAAGNYWRHLLASWDLSTVGRRHLYMNGGDDTNQVTFTNDVIAYEAAGYSRYCGYNPNLGGNRWTGGMADFYFDDGNYLDLSLEERRGRFMFYGVDGLWHPKDLGEFGELPTTLPATVYFRSYDGELPSRFARNNGAGPDYALTDLLTASLTSPLGPPIAVRQIDITVQLASQYGVMGIHGLTGPGGGLARQGGVGGGLESLNDDISSYGSMGSEFEGMGSVGFGLSGTGVTGGLGIGTANNDPGSITEISGDGPGSGGTDSSGGYGESGGDSGDSGPW